MTNNNIKHVLIATLIASACSTSYAAEKSINIDGSSTVHPLTKEVADEFQKIRKIKVNVNISGTGGGFAKFCRGETQIQNASRPILKKEMELCKEAGVQYIELPVAYDALTVVVNKENNFIKSLSVDELKKIWQPGAQGKIKSWRQVNPSWPNVPLTLYGPGSDSGTFDYFTEAIVGKAKQSRKDYTASENDNDLVHGVTTELGALGYFGYAYFEENQDKLAAVPIVSKKDAPAVLPSAESVKNGSYQPLSRPLFIYVNATAAAFKPEVKEFVDFYLYLKSSPNVAKRIRFIPLPANEYIAVNKHWKALKPGSGFDGMPEVGVKIEDLIARIK